MTPSIEGQMIARLALQHGLSCSQLAKKAGVAPSTLYKLVSGEAQSIRASTLLLVAQALGVSPDVVRGAAEAPAPLPEVPAPRRPFLPPLTVTPSPEGGLPPTPEAWPRPRVGVRCRRSSSLRGTLSRSGWRTETWRTSAPWLKGAPRRSRGMSCSRSWREGRSRCC